MLLTSYAISRPDPPATRSARQTLPCDMENGRTTCVRATSLASRSPCARARISAATAPWLWASGVDVFIGACAYSVLNSDSCARDLQLSYCHQCTLQWNCGLRTYSPARGVERPAICVRASASTALQRSKRERSSAAVSSGVSNTSGGSAGERYPMNAVVSGTRFDARWRVRTLQGFKKSAEGVVDPGRRADLWRST